MKTFPPYVQRFLALGILSCVCAFMYATISPVFSTYNENQIRISQLQKLKQKYRQISTFGDKIPQFKRKQSKNVKHSWYLQPAKKSIAKANLRTRLKNIATTNGARIESIRELGITTKQGSKQHGLIYVGLRIKMTGSYLSVFNSLHNYETSNPLLFINTLQISGDRVRKRASSPQAILTATFSIKGALVPKLNSTNSDLKKPSKEGVQ